MNQEYIKPDPWSIIEEGFDPELVKSSESLFSLGNGAMGQRANFEEAYSGPTFQGSYIAGVYYPDHQHLPSILAAAPIFQWLEEKSFLLYQSPLF